MFQLQPGYDAVGSPSSAAYDSSLDEWFNAWVTGTLLVVSSCTCVPLHQNLLF